MESLKQKCEDGMKLIKEMEKMFEIWKPVKDYDNYSISSFGRIRNNKTKKILKPCLNTTKYEMIDLRNGEKYTKQLISRLVAKAFIPNPENKPFLDHSNGSILDNHFLNLRWVTRQENGLNRKLQKNNTSGHVGVYQESKSKLYVSHLRSKGKQIVLGRFINLEDAIKARKEGELKWNNI